MTVKSLRRKEAPFIAGFTRDVGKSKNDQLMQLIQFISSVSKADVSKINWKGHTIAFELDGHYDYELDPVGYLVWDGEELDFKIYTNSDFNALFTEVNSAIGGQE